ncbi:MAG TPA: hypothetical protein VEF04_00835 [Blastocatellia bacterium]|nr:hypothetical protein [Blastocatellia bacterium]
MAKTQPSKQDKPQQHTGEHIPDEYRRDLYPNENAGQNIGLIGAHDEKNGRTAYDDKQLHAKLRDWPDDELKLIRIVPTGVRLEQNATYLDLNDPEQREFKATGQMTAEPGHRYVAKDSVPYQIWNKLRGITNAERTGTASEEGRTFSGGEV